MSIRRLPAVGLGGKHANDEAMTCEFFLEADDSDGQMMLFVRGQQWRHEEDGIRTLTQEGTCALPVDGTHLQHMVDWIREFAEKRGITIV